VAAQRGAAQDSHPPLVDTHHLRLCTSSVASRACARSPAGPFSGFDQVDAANTFIQRVGVLAAPFPSARAEEGAGGWRLDTDPKWRGTPIGLLPGRSAAALDAVDRAPPGSKAAAEAEASGASRKKARARGAQDARGGNADASSPQQRKRRAVASTSATLAAQRSRPLVSTLTNSS